MEGGREADRQGGTRAAADVPVLKMNTRMGVWALLDQRRL